MKEQHLPCERFESKTLESHILAHDSAELRKKHDVFLHRDWYEVKNEEAGVYVLGVKHTYAPEGDVVTRLEEAMQDYLEHVVDAEAVVMLEGFHGYEEKELPTGTLLEGIDSLEGAMKKYGEGGYVLWQLAQQGREISVLSPELPEDGEGGLVERLVGEGVAREHIAAYLFLRALDGVYASGNVDDDERTLQEKIALFFLHLEHLVQPGWISNVWSRDTWEQSEGAAREEYVASVNKAAFASVRDLLVREGMSADHLPSLMEVVRAESEASVREEVNRFVDPMDVESTASAVNDVARRWNDLRDQHLVFMINDAVQRKKKPFVLFGGSHVLAIEDAIHAIQSPQI